jgi:MFS family permease
VCAVSAEGILSMNPKTDNTVTVGYESRTQAKSSRYKWWVVFMLWFVCFLNYGDRQAINSIFPKLKEEFGFDKFQLGMIGSAFMWVYAFGAPFAGYVGDRVRRKDLILGGCLFWSAVTVTTSWCGKLWQFVTVRALEGFGETFYFPASMSLISDYHGPATRSKAMAFHQSSVYAGTIMGSWMAAWLAQHYGWRSGFYIFGGAGVVLVLILYRFVREPQRGQSEPTAESAHMPLSLTELGPVFQKPSVVLLMLAFLGANFVATIFLTWTPTFLVEKFHFELAAAGLSGSAFIHLASAVSAPLGGVLADRLCRRHVGGRMIVQAAGLLLGSVFVFLLGTTNSVGTLLTSMTIFGFGKGLYDSNIFASLYDAIEPRARSTAAGVMNTVGWGGGALGPLVVGWLATHGPRGTEIENMSWAIAATGAIYIIGAGLLLLVAFIFIGRDAATNRGTS